MRLSVSIIATARFFAASAASAAVTYSVIANAEGGDLGAMSPGETATLDIFIRSDGEAVIGLAASVFGYDGALTYVSGITSATFLNRVPTGPGMGFGGLPNTSGDAPVENPFESDGIRILNGVLPGGSTATGANDVSPVTGEAGGPHARLVFRVNRSTFFGIGSNSDYADAVVGEGGVYLAVTNATVGVFVPEPRTALLMTLGLAGLAATGRRSRTISYLRILRAPGPAR